MRENEWRFEKIENRSEFYEKIDLRMIGLASVHLNLKVFLFLLLLLPLLPINRMGLRKARSRKNVLSANVF